MHPNVRRLLPILLGLALLPIGARAEDTADQKAVRTRREALTKAVNDHDVKAIKSFLDPSFTAKTKDGQTVTYEQIIQALDQIFENAKDFHETTNIEKIEVNGDKADVTVSETDTFTDPNGNKQTQNTHTKESWKKVKERWMLVGEVDV